jgi:phasin
MSETPLKSETTTKGTGPQNNKSTCCETPNFEMPKVEIPAAYREFAGKGVEQTRQTYEKLKAAAEETTALFEKSYATTADVAGDYRAKVIEAMYANISAAFDFASALAGVRSIPEMVERPTAHARKQFDAVSIQNREIWGLVQKIAIETVRPATTSIAQVLKYSKKLDKAKGVG